ncbi:hypothetical protein B566_EDAN013172 [Ephemera danica]|nr:hypothetical protein B566_EDAN013172 [Ephemera danica]
MYESHAKCASPIEESHNKSPRPNEESHDRSLSPVEESHANFPIPIEESHTKSSIIVEESHSKSPSGTKEFPDRSPSTAKSPSSIEEASLRQESPLMTADASQSPQALHEASIAEESGGKTPETAEEMEVDTNELTTKPRAEVTSSGLSIEDELGHLRDELDQPEDDVVADSPVEAMDVAEEGTPSYDDKSQLVAVQEPKVNGDMTLTDEEQFSNQSEVSTQKKDSAAKTKQSKKAKNRRTVAPSVTEEQEVSGSTSPTLSCREYAQYLGLQPTVKFKCIKCGETNFPSITKLKEHQNTCLRVSRSTTPEPASTSSSSMQPQMRITRKVYLCSSCGTYFENWNLYIHMREVHRRHVCLCCLSMFLHADKLALHMSTNHNMSIETFRTPDEFLSAHPMSCYLTCCTCERIFSEQDNFFTHECGDKVATERRGCATCGLQFAHKSTCPHSNVAALRNKFGPEPGPSRQSESEPSPLSSIERDIKRLPAKFVTKNTEVRSTTSNCQSNSDATSPSSSSINNNNTGSNTPKRSPLQTKRKPTCLRIKLAPVSKIKPSNRKSLNISDAKPISELDDNSDSEGSQKSPLDLNDELSLLADEDSNPVGMQNGERSPSRSPVSEKPAESPVDEPAKEEEPESAQSEDTGEVPDRADSELATAADNDVSMSSIKEPESPPQAANLADSMDQTDGTEKPEEKMDLVDDDDEKDEWHIDEQQSSKDVDEASCDLNDAPVSVPEPPVEEEEEWQLAGEDAPLIDLHLETSVEEIPIQNILKQAVQEACNHCCVYCTHANRIAVNGKQLAIHLVSEHRYQLVTSTERLPIDKFVELVKEKMPELEQSFFNCDTYDSSNKEAQSVFVKSYECFQCRYVTKIHKDLYLHNRKMHQKNSLVCIMCKTNFYSYSELLCHLCPGIYMVANQPLFRCCFCPLDNLPSAFRFMVHVRKVHQACDVCLELCGDQQKLSNHVWKHKLLHFCYRCGIAYRNKPDITKHLFWKHGTESVLCKRCLHKKWPYVYHFCIPPSLFTCEECNATFSRAVALKVHKRLHTNELLYPCDQCTDSFISRKLLARHDRTIHNPPPPEEKPEEVESPAVDDSATADEHINVESVQDEPEVKSDETKDANSPEDADKKAPKVVDVYDLPPLNLSSESEDDSDTETEKVQVEKAPEPVEDVVDAAAPESSEVPQDSVWENFKDYKSSKDKAATDEPEAGPSTKNPKATQAELLQNIMFDHDYFSFCDVAPDSPDVIVDDETPPAVTVEPTPVAEEANTSFDHNYCSNEADKVPEQEAQVSTPKKKQKSPKKKHKSGESGSSSSDSDSSSSSSDSSSCSCGTNCSCSSSSSSSSGSSSSDSSDSDSSTSEKKAAKKARRKERRRKHSNEKQGEAPIVNGHADAGMSAEEPNVEDVAGPPVMFFHESDLDTNESETDEDFYDEQPRLLMPSRNLLLLSSAVDSLMSPQATPAPTPPPAEIPPSDTYSTNNGLLQSEQVNNISSKPNKGKKRKRSLSMPRSKHKSSQDMVTPGMKKIRNPSFHKTHTPLNSQYSESLHSPGSSDLRGGSGSETDVRLSKRKRVPKRFYGDSSDEESLASAPMTPGGYYIPAPIPPPPPPPPPPQPAVVYKPPKKRSRPSTTSETDYAPPRSPTEADLKLKAILDFVAAGHDGRTAADDNYKKKPNTPKEPPKQPKLILTIGNHVTRPEVSSSSSGSESDDEADDEEELVVAAPGMHQGFMRQQQLASAGYQAQTLAPARQANVKLYCYCQCPYDEVSEMIACDGKNCAIEWFHFECVGITIPPKGKWYCPDCRKRYNIAEPAPNPSYFYNPSSEYMRSADPTHSYSGT